MEVETEIMKNFSKIILHQESMILPNRLYFQKVYSYNFVQFTTNCMDEFQLHFVFQNV